MATYPVEAHAHKCPINTSRVCNLAKLQNLNRAHFGNKPKSENVLGSGILSAPNPNAEFFLNKKYILIYQIIEKNQLT
ncbi:hypothetical protein WN943_016859 [Citrus x changshan-huyou]